MTNSSAPALVSGAILIGDHTPPAPAQAVEVFKEPVHHLTALSSILAHYAHKTGFLPQGAKPATTTLKPAYDAFLKDAIAFYGFNETRFKETKSLVLDGSLFQLEQAIREFLDEQQDGQEEEGRKDEGKVGHDDDGKQGWGNAALIARHLRDLVPGYLPSDDAGDEKTWVLSLLILCRDKDGGAVRIQHAQATLEMGVQGDNDDDKKEPKKKNSQEIRVARIPPQASAKFEIGELELLAPTLMHDALKLGEEIPIVDVRSAIGLLSSPKA